MKPPHSTQKPAKSKSALAPGLYLVATPIGNLEDITLRALRVLAQADVIACEDTRSSAVLLRHHAIATPTLSYHEHNAAQMRPVLLQRLAGGQSVALISDAGTPLISDPGYKLVAAAVEAGASVIPIPGASAPLAALVGSALPTDAFVFLGFLPPKSVARQKSAARYAALPVTQLWFEAPSRLAGSLADLAEVYGPQRRAVVARELTKLHETFHRGTLAELAAYFSAHPPRGEMVLAIAPASEEAPAPEALEDMLRAALASHSVKDAAALVAEATGVSRRDLYQKALLLAREAGV